MPKVFISYVREDSNDVQRLVSDLKAHGIDVWFDQTHLRVGDRWARVIQREIAQGDFFLSCFSQAYTDRHEGYVFEELRQAIARMRRLQPDETWFLPVLLSDCKIPDWGINPGETLDAIQRVELYKDWDTGIRELLRVIEPERLPFFTNSIGMEFVLIPAGRFMMGSPDSDPDAYDEEKPAHQVTLSQAFYLGKYPVTQAQWKAVMGMNPSDFKGAGWPVENVSWDDVQTFMQKLNERVGADHYRLPTEAEWEYACRAGSNTRYHFGDDAARLGDYAWYAENSGSGMHPVGQKQPNAWGLYDMHGNVGEWVQDWYHDYTANPVIDPIGPTSGAHRVIRGGGWGHPAQGARAAARDADAPGYRDAFIGFRCLIV